MPEKAKLLVLTSTLPRFEGDPEPSFVLHLAQALSERFEVTLLAPMGPQARTWEKCQDVEIHRYRYAPFRRWETLAYPGGIMPRLRAEPWRWLQVPLLMAGLWRAIRRLQHTHRFDIIHCHWLIPQGLAAVLALNRRRRPPLVVTSHGGDIYTLMKWPTRHLLRWVLKRSTAVTVVSDRLLEMVRGFAGKHAGKVTMIPMGVATESFNRQQRAPDWAEQLNLQEPVVLFVGRLAEKKGLTYLLDALVQPTLRDKEFTLAIVGDGPLRADLEHQTQELELGDKVRFLGPLAYARLPRCFASADLVAAPSIHASDGDCEGLPTVILEAMASGTAVVSTPVGGITQVIRDGETGRLVPERDAESLAVALAELLNAPSRRKRLADHGLHAVQDFSWKRIGNRYAEVLSHAMDSPPEQGAAPP